ncbi:MAG: hypothetical protein PHY87_04925 [Sphaerochaeta sp.]|nr:hypothetical protein [Sphaerochaeta sp.]
MKVVFPLLLLACVCSLPAKAYWTLQTTPSSQTYQVSMQQGEQNLSLGFDARKAAFSLEVKHLRYRSGLWSLTSTARQLSESFPSLESRLWNTVCLSYGATSLSFVEAGPSQRGLVLEWPRFSLAALNMGSEALTTLYVPYQRMMLGNTFIVSLHERHSLASLVLEPSFSPSMGLHLSSSVSVRFGPFSYHTAYRTNRWERISSLGVESNLHAVRIMSVASTALGYPPLFGGETQELEHAYASRLGFDLWGCEWLLGWQQNLQGSGRAERQVLVSLARSGVSLELGYRMGEGVILRLQSGVSSVQWSPEGFSYHLELKQGAVEFQVRSDPNQVRILYRFTTGRDTGFPQPR